MEFLKSCNTNAQAIGDFEAIAYQAVCITRNTTHPFSTLRDWNSPDDIRAVESELRQRLHLVVQDATRPWLWLFQPTTAEKAGHATVDLPDLDGYHLQREQAGCVKAIELARPPMRALNPHAASAAPSSTAAPHKSVQSGGPRLPQGSNPTIAADQQQPLDCVTLYELFTSSVIALISFNLVRDCDVVALNYRTFVSKSSAQQDNDHVDDLKPPLSHWLTSISVHWTGSGVLLVSTFTEQNSVIRCVNDVTSTAEQKQLAGTCVRVAPNGLLAKIVSFEDPLESITEEIGHRQRKKAKMGSLEQSVAKWKSIVKRWLGWRGYALPNLDQTSSWVRIRGTQMTLSSLSSPITSSPDRDILWPRALCYFYTEERMNTSTIGQSGVSNSRPSHSLLQRFETPDFTGFRDPLDIAQSWFLGKPDRDRVLEAQRKAKKAEEDVARRKEEHVGLFPSSPVNARTAVYGDLQAVSGVYPTPPDGVAPGTGISYSDTPSISGATSNVILAPGGNNPAINLSGPQDNALLDGQQSLTSPVFPSASDNFNTSSVNDDLFEDMEEDGYGGDGVNDADFDFFDGPDDEDVDMLDVPGLPGSSVALVKHIQEPDLSSISNPHIKEEMADPSAALENALASASPHTEVEAQCIITPQMVSTPAPPAQKQRLSIASEETSQLHEKVSPSKVPTPPLSPSMIAKTLQSSPSGRSAPQHHQRERTDRQRDSAFDPISFSRKLSISDARYQDGRFSAHREKNNSPNSRTNIGPPRMKSLRDIPLLTRLRHTINAASAQRIPEIDSLARAVSDDSDSASDSSSVFEEDSDLEVNAEPGAVIGSLVLPAKRKLPLEDNATPLSVTSFAESLGADWQDIHGLQFDDVHLASFEPNSWDWSLVGFPSPTERPLSSARFIMPILPQSPAQMPDTPTSQSEFTMELADDRALSGKDSIAVTQIVTDQMVSATLDILEEDSQAEQVPNNRGSTETRWHMTISKIFSNATDCTLPALAAVHDMFPDVSAQSKGQQRLPPRKSNESTAIPGNQLYPINPPFLRVRRADTNWDMLPPAIAFWEPLGLSPVSAPKNIVTFCIYPHSDSLRLCLENFLLNIQLAYDSCKLGNHTRVETVTEFAGGLVPCRVSTHVTQREAFKVLRETCVQLGKLLAIQHMRIREQQDSKIDAFVVYIVDPFGGPSALWELCSAFWALFQAYGQGPPGRPDQPQKPDLVLQVIPLKYIASFDAPVILDPSTYINLAREVYARCPPSAPSSDKTPLTIYTAPAFQLEEALPRSVPFKLISEPPSDLLRENCYMHLGYAISLDGTWITAAWTDSCGKSQAVVSYHLGTRVFGEIAKEIWQTTIEILQSRRVHWRVCVAKAGVMDREELETWIFLISCPTQLNLFITLLTVDTDPPYKLTPTMSTSSSTASQPSANTPGSTPQAGVSPDPTVGLTPAATPSAETITTDPSADPEARLIDVTDETWGIILAHRLHNSNSTNQFSPALISGLLVKRGETFATSHTINHPIPDPEHGPIVVGVNMLWIGAVGSTRAATSPFPPSGSDGLTPGGTNANPYGNNSTPPSPSPTQDGSVRSTSSLMWTPTVQTRATAENLLKEILSQFRALGLLAKLRGMRGTRHGSVPWHIAAAKRGVTGLGRVMTGL
ncbi:mediator complex subunit 13 C-terminal-domain-containing protein [Pyrenochaeta sp. MPI-SDFR-AT-0127]|nr:mediator complex subunit 13 C-terminal-domain-containing protein [Pyrenochaeta sp. MPI-SDFR-AT-0127]